MSAETEYKNGDQEPILLKKILKRLNEITGGGGGGGGAVSSVAGRTGDVLLAQADIAGLTTSSSPVFAGLSITGQGVQDSHRVFVSQRSGSDTTGDGSIFKPFATTAKAYDVIDANADATSTSPYVVYLFPGTYAMTRPLSDYTHTMGGGITFASGNTPDIFPVVRITGNVINASGKVSSIEGVGFVDNGQVLRNVGDSFFVRECVFTSAVYVDSIGGGYFHLADCSGIMFLFRGNTTVEFFDGSVSTDTGSGADTPIVAKFYSSNLTVLDVSNVGNTPRNVAVSTFNSRVGSLSVTSSVSFDCSVVSKGSTFGSVSLSGDNTSFDASTGAVDPGDLSISSGAPTVTFSDDCATLGYFPATPGDWAGTAPATVAEALDRLAAATPGA